MGLTTAEAQVEKKCYKNQTAGWLGVVKLDHLGAQVGVGIEPYGTVWLTDDEATLTARAPAKAEDNPFVEKMFQFYDEKGAIVEQMMRQLVLSEEGERYNPASERFVPGQDESPAISHDINLDAVGAAQREADDALAGDSDRPVPTEASAATLVPSSTAAVPPSHAKPGRIDTSAPAEPEEDQREDQRAASWTDTTERTEEPQQGSLRGSHDAPPTAAESDEAKTGSPTGAPPQQPAPEAVVKTEIPNDGEAHVVLDGKEVAVEEHAGVTQAGEETGAADLPAGDAPEGEFAAHEEVGSPDAPAKAEVPA